MKNGVLWSKSPPPPTTTPLVIFEEPIFLKNNFGNPFFVNLERSSQQNWRTSEFKQVVWTGAFHPLHCCLSGSCCAV